MRLALVLLCLVVAGCVAPAPGLTPAKLPETWDDAWVRADAVGSMMQPAAPTADEMATFGEAARETVDVRASISPEDFHGSRLYDGFDFSMQPLDNDSRPVKKLGHLEVILYSFDPETLEGKGVELMRWHASASRMAAFWKPGLIDSAYRMKLAWTYRPTCDYTTAEVRFTTTGGKTVTTLLLAVGIDQPRYRWLKE